MMDTSFPFVTVYTITYNQVDRVLATVRSLLRQAYPVEQFGIVVLDDGSQDHTIAALQQVKEANHIPLKILPEVHEGDYMSARRWNQCIAASERETAIFIQVDDVVVRPDFIASHVKWHCQAGDYLVTGAKYEGTVETWSLNHCRRSSLASVAGGATKGILFTAVWGASLSFTRRMMARICQPPYDLPYDERMRGWGYHEVEFAYRMKRAGVVLIYDPAAGVFHKDHTPDLEARRSLNRERLIAEGENANIDYLLRKHRLATLPRW